MTPAEAAARLEAILLAENAALERARRRRSRAPCSKKSSRPRGALSTDGLSLEVGERLRGLAAENRRLLERAIKVQGRIIAMVARAAQAAPPVARYGAQGPGDPGRRRARPHAAGVTLPRRPMLGRPHALRLRASRRRPKRAAVAAPFI